MIKKVLLILILCFNTVAFSQIIGSVKDNNNETLAFVNIYVENTYKGTTSNDDGNYELNITETGNYTIVFKF